ncbi:threonine aldolase family protein [Streptococcus himalayensis]|uniref:Amino acid lyase n=1 Tax=Streptococcus himalayensis TaxID=1888195 RepID=A0A917A7Y4_9STRE|nr:aminotransferase class V-fold PLP-dependent enzyme [Streptococcus himalayensis]GGE29534.1 amino acid lyase [Streptococcus himalayensis]
MIHFENDYNRGVHKDLLQALVDTNDEGLAGYGFDQYSERAKDKIRVACQAPDAEVFFLTGGTQTNQIVIDSLLQSYEGVIAADTGHISVHEAGAIEFAGHKVLTLPHEYGKISARQVETYLENFYKDANHAHMVYPGMVYLSFPTEYGTLYTKHELTEIAGVCRRYEIPLFIDGARLGYGLASPMNDVTLADLAHVADVFYIGGTKMGALCGEAVVFSKDSSPKRFPTIVKQHGALLAKGRLLGVQFDRFFTDDLYLKIGQTVMEKTERLKEILTEKGYTFFLESPTNQQFVILENAHYKELSKEVAMGFWETYDENHVVVRLATSWSTTEQDLEELQRLL